METSGTSVATHPPRRRVAQPNRARRLSASVWLPWLAGLAVVLIIAIAAAALVGRDRGQAGVPEPVIVAQERVAAAAAQSFRRSVNEAVNDVGTASLLLQVAPEADIQATLEQMLAAQDRWAALTVVDGAGQVLAEAGDGGVPMVDLDARAAAAGATVVETAGRPVVVVHAPLVRPGEPEAALMGVIRQPILDGTLAVAEPGGAAVVDAEGGVLASSGLVLTSQDLPDADLAGAASLASRGSTGAAVPESDGERARVVAWAPVQGYGPAGTLGWGAVVDRQVGELVPADPANRIPGVVYGIVVALVALVVFGWIRRRVLLPLGQLEDEAERVAYGDLRRPVPVARLDDVGRIARALERLRLQLIGRRARDTAGAPGATASSHESDGPPPGAPEGG